MSTTNFAAISSHVMSEVLGNALPPLFRKYVLLDKLNRSNIDGDPSEKRKIPVQNALPEAAPSFEGAAVSGSAMSYGSPIELTPVGYKTIVPMTLKAIRRRMPGATFDGVVAAINAGDPSALPIVADAVTQSFDAHLRAAERLGLGLFSGLSRSAGTSTQVLTPLAIIDAQTKLLGGDLASSVQGKPEHEEMIIMLDEIGVGQLRNNLATGSGSGIASLWANPQTDLSIFSLSPDTNRSGLRGGYAGTAIYACDSVLQLDDGTDRTGAIFCVGRGAAGDVGGQRGFAEFCEGHAPAIQFDYDAKAGVLNVVADWEWVVGEHTDLHGVKIVYKRTIT
jgi:hypothetical protein